MFEPFLFLIYNAVQACDANADCPTNVRCISGYCGKILYFLQFQKIFDQIIDSLCKTKLLVIFDFFKSKGCITIGGDSPGKVCIFPFTYNDITYTSCALGDDGYWCSTKVDTNGFHIGNRGNWGTCDSDCNPTAPRIQSGNRIALCSCH